MGRDYSVRPKMSLRFTQKLLVMYLPFGHDLWYFFKSSEIGYIRINRTKPLLKKRQFIGRLNYARRIL